MDLDLSSIETAAIRLGETEVPVRVIPGRDVAPRSGTGPVWREADGDLSGLLSRWSERMERWQAARHTRLFTSPTALQEADAGSLPRGAPAKRASGGTAAGPSPATADSGRARLIGILAHLVLESWDFADDPERLKGRVTAICRTGIQSELVTQGDVGQIEAELHDLFTTFAASQSYVELQRATILGRETPFAIPWDEPGHQPCIMEGVIDLIYRLDGKVWIADYKTDRVEARELANRASVYQAQADVYRTAVSRCLGLEQVGFKFFFLRSGSTVEV
jgi:ATP-dependent helicase/nuclease subunit A